VRTDFIYTDSYEVQDLEASYVFVTDSTRTDHLIHKAVQRMMENFMPHDTVFWGVMPVVW